MKTATWAGRLIGAAGASAYLIATCTLVLFISSTARADVLLPDAFGGIWSIESVTTDCATGDTLGVNTDPAELFCPGKSLEELFADGGFIAGVVCTGTVTSTTVNATCTGTFEAFPGCTGSVTVIYTGLVVGDEITLTSQATVTYEGACLTLPDSCTSSEGTGTLVTRDVTTQCATSVQPQGWGRIKAAYR